MPFFDNVAYLKIGVGDHFGAIDIIGSSIEKFELDKFIEHKNLLKRQFTVAAMAENVETLTLSLQDIHRMKQEFYEQYEELFQQASIRLRRTWIIKLMANRSCHEQIRNFNKFKRRNSKLQGLPSPAYLKNKNKVSEQVFMQKSTNAFKKESSFKLQVYNLDQLDNDSFDGKINVPEENE